MTLLVRGRRAYAHMKFNRTKVAASVSTLAGSVEVHESSIGFNYLIEENVGDLRRDQVEAFEMSTDDVRQIVKSYFDGAIQGISRGHRSTTFDISVNSGALLPATVDPNQKIIRLERIDRVLSKDPSLDFKRVRAARGSDDAVTLQAFVDLFSTYPGERPSFSAFKSEVDDDLKSPDWLHRLIDRMGLYHFYPFDSGQTYSFALMEYTAKDILAQATKKGIDRPFAVATVLECQENPAFFPVPKGSQFGFTVDLRERVPPRPNVREILHIRYDYSWRNVSKLAQWSGASEPDISASRNRHLATVRRDTGRADFGKITS